MIDKNTIGKEKIDYIVIDILNKMNDSVFKSKILSIINGYHTDLKNAMNSDLPRKLKLFLIQSLLNEKKKWIVEYLKDEDIKLKTHLNNCFICKKRNYERQLMNEK